MRFSTCHLIMVLASSGVVLCRQIACFTFEFSPSSFPYATAPYNLEAMAAGANKGVAQVKLLGAKRGSGAPLPNNKPAAASPRCTLELQVVQRLSGHCVDFGRTNACNAGTYIYPFHPDCTTQEGDDATRRRS